MKKTICECLLCPHDSGVLVPEPAFAPGVEFAEV